MKEDKNIGEVDMVYLWVNGNDPKWLAKRNATIGKTEAKSSVNCEGRYADNDELRYSLRSVEMYAPWIRKIFIVTDNQVPSWLDTSNPKIEIIDHKDIMPEECLPCFNSNVIEHFLSEIPGLSEHFLYANDDMYINRPVTPNTFFALDGLPIIRQNRRPFRKLALVLREKFRGRPMSNYNRTIHQTEQMVERRYGKYFSGKAHHNIDSYLKSDLRHVRKLFMDEIGATLSNHVRRPNDVQRCLYHSVALAEKRGHLRYVSQRESLRIHIEKERHYAKLENYNPIFFCTNDSEYANESNRRREKEFLSHRFPNKSQFEKD
ncbi:MAG: stealth family protein [Roseburia sp.]|nr:stealth family protein [Roseburia sp.]